MPIPINKYLDIKNNYCLCYYGLNKEYIIQLRALRPAIESKYPDLKLYISVDDNNLYLLKKEERVISKNELKNKKLEMSYIREIHTNIEFHTIEAFLEESDIQIKIELPDRVNLLKTGAILTNGIFPNRSLSYKQIEKCERFLEKVGIKKIEFNPGVEAHDRIDIAIGVENEIIYEYALKGIKVYLIPTGNGEKLFLKMFPKNEVINLNS